MLEFVSPAEMVGSYFLCRKGGSPASPGLVPLAHCPQSGVVRAVVCWVQLSLTHDPICCGIREDQKGRITCCLPPRAALCTRGWLLCRQQGGPWEGVEGGPKIGLQYPTAQEKDLPVEDESGCPCA